MKDQVLLEEACSIGDVLSRNAYFHRGRANWITRAIPYNISAEPTDSFPEMNNLNASVYSGTAGVGLFLARLYKFSNNQAHRRVALGALRHAVSQAFHVSTGPTGQLGGMWRYGFYLGTLGIAWAAHEVGLTIGEPALERDARRMVRRLATMTGQPMENDVMFGSAGGIPILLDLEKQGYPEAAGLAEELGNNLLAQGTRIEGVDGLSWSNAGHVGKLNLTGFSHGTAGIALSLAQMGKHTGDQRFTEAAQAAIQYEASTYVAAQENWPNYQATVHSDGTYPCANAWCHGAPGIGLGRAAMQPWLSGSQIRKDVEIAARTTRRFMAKELESPGKDHMACHGSFGTLDCLWIMEESLGHAGAMQEMQDIARMTVECHGAGAVKKWGETVHWPTGVTNGTYPTLMTGLAGMGHWLLRLHSDGKLPTILLPAKAWKGA